MNNQFATQFLFEDLEDVSNEELPFDIEAMVEKAMSFGLTRIEALAMVQEIIKSLKLDEMSTTGGGVTGGPTAASWDPQGPTGTGEQIATTRAFKKEKYQEGTFEDDEIAVFDGGEDGHIKIFRKADGSFHGVGDDFDFTAKDEQELLRKTAMWGYKLISGTVYEDAPRLAGSPAKTNKQGSKNLSAYSSVGFTKAPNAEEAGKKMKSIDVKMLWKEGEEEVEVSWSMIKDVVKMLGKRDLGIEPNSPTGQAFLKDVEDAFHEGLIKSENELLHFIHGYRETLRESRAYSQFKKQTAMRPKDQQMHEAVKIIHKKLEEVSKLVEFAQQMRTELSEGENTLEYKHNTKKIFEKINSKVVEVYTKTRNLK